MVCGNRKVVLRFMPLSLPRRHALYAATRASAYLSYYTRPHVWPRVVHTGCYAASCVAAYPSRPRGAYALTRVDTYITKANIRADTVQARILCKIRAYTCRRVSDSFSIRDNGRGRVY